MSNDAFKFDAARFKHLQPKAPLPVLKERGIDLMSVGSCGPRDGKTIGCEHYPCPLLERFAAKRREGAHGEYGPRNGAVRIVGDKQSGGGMREVVKSCWQFNNEKAGYEGGGGIMDWVADEGETFVERGSRQTVPGGPSKDYFEKVTVPQHAWVDDDMDMVQSAMEAELRKLHEEREKLARRAEAMGMTVPAGNDEGTEGERIQPDRPKRR